MVADTLAIELSSVESHWYVGLIERKSSAKTAVEVGISVNTVKSHLTGVFKKLVMRRTHRC